MVDYSNPAFVKARNAAAVRKEIESSGRSFETFAATNLTDAEIFTMTNRLKPLSMNDINYYRLKLGSLCNACKAD